MKKIKTLVAISCISIMTMTALTGCGKKVSLETAIQNSATKINSYAYSGQLSASVTSKEQGLDSTKIKLDFDGKSKQTEDKKQNQVNLKLDTGDVKVSMPVYSEVSLKDSNSFAMFIGVNGILEGIEKGKPIQALDVYRDKNIYISSTDLKDTLKMFGGEKAVSEFDKGFKSSIESKDKLLEVKKDLLTNFTKYTKDKGSKVQEFKALDKKSKESNGIYEITLKADDIKTILTNYYKDEKCVQHLNDFYATSGDTKKINPDECIKNIEKELNNVQNLTLKTDLTIEDNLITKYHVEFTGEDSKTKFNINADVNLSDINKEFKIEMPDKDKNTISVKEIIQKYILVNMVKNAETNKNIQPVK